MLQKLCYDVIVVGMNEIYFLDDVALKFTIDQRYGDIETCSCLESATATQKHKVEPILKSTCGDQMYIRRQFIFKGDHP